MIEFTSNEIFYFILVNYHRKIADLIGGGTRYGPVSLDYYSRGTAPYLLDSESRDTGPYL